MAPKQSSASGSPAPPRLGVNIPVLTPTRNQPGMSPSRNIPGSAGSQRVPSPGGSVITDIVGPASPASDMPTFYAGKISDDPDWVNVEPRLLSTGEKAILARQEVTAKYLDGLVELAIKQAGHSVRASRAPKAGVVGTDEQGLVQTLLNDHRELVKRATETRVTEIQAGGDTPTDRAGERMYAQADAFRKSLVDAVGVQQDTSGTDVAQLVNGMTAPAIRMLYQSALKTFAPNATGGKAKKTKASTTQEGTEKRRREAADDDDDDDYEVGEGDDDDVIMEEGGRTSRGRSPPKKSKA